jgi:transcriptional regulator with XRE-family HTH domain
LRYVEKSNKGYVYQLNRLFGRHGTMTDDLQNRRIRLGLTQKQLGERLGVSGHTVLRWETGLSTMSRTAILLLDRIVADAAGIGRSIAQVVMPVTRLPTRGGADGAMVVLIVLQISAELLDDAIREQPPIIESHDGPDMGVQ